MCVTKKTFTKEYIVCMLVYFLVVFSFSTSTLAYAITMMALIIIAHIEFIKKFEELPKFVVFVFAYCTIIPVIMSMIQGKIQDVFMVNVSLIMPFLIGATQVDEGDKYKQCIGLGVIAILFDVMQPYISALREMNVNGYSVMIFMFFSAIVIACRMRKTVLSMGMLGYCVYALTNSGSRNAFIIFLVVVMLVFVPYKWLKNKIVFRAIYMGALGYQCISVLFLKLVAQNSFLMNVFNKIVGPFFNKAWGVQNRNVFYQSISDAIWSQDIMTILFGKGEAFTNAHNGFYQVMYIYGLVGFVFIMILYIMIFERAFRVITENDNRFVLGCVICLWGVFLLQGAEVFLLGCKGCAAIPLLLGGIILREYKCLNRGV